jgi:hypothetical protein
MACSKQTIVHKRGDTFERTCTYKRGGALFDLTGTTIVVTIETSCGTLVDTLSVVLAAQSGATLGQFTISKAYVSTESWPLGRHVADIQYTFPDGKRLSTRTFFVEVVEDVTPP